MDVVGVGPGDGGQSTLITLRVTAARAKQLIELFKSGDLQNLGITDIQIHPVPSDGDLARKPWTDLEAAKNPEPKDKGRPR